VRRWTRSLPGPGDAAKRGDAQDPGWHGSGNATAASYRCSHPAGAHAARNFGVAGGLLAVKARVPPGRVLWSPKRAEPPRALQARAGTRTGAPHHPRSKPPPGSVHLRFILGV